MRTADWMGIALVAVIIVAVAFIRVGLDLLTHPRGESDREDF